MSLGRRQFLQLLAATPVLALTGASAGQALTAAGTPAVFVHYMPWFETPATSTDGRWGWHWAMDTCNPDRIDPRTGRREIASHYHPLIGPYASSDPDVLEYHLLLMKLSGVTGVLVDWYGASGRDEETHELLRNADALIDRVGAYGLQFAVVYEDRTTSDLDRARDDLAYVRDRYLTRPEYVRTADGPLLLVFGPISFDEPDDWATLLAVLGADVDLRTLWHNDAAGSHADSSFVWPFQRQDGDHLRRALTYYRQQSAAGATVMGVAYPGFEDFYAQGEDGGRTLFTIPPDHGKTFDQVLDLVAQEQAVIDLLQIATWNDFGEGTMVEPTEETGFARLARLQAFTGSPAGEADLQLVHDLYRARAEFAGDGAVQAQLDEAARLLVAGRLADGHLAMAQVR